MKSPSGTSSHKSFDPEPYILALSIWTSRLGPRLSGFALHLHERAIGEPHNAKVSVWANQATTVVERVKHVKHVKNVKKS